MAREEDWDQDEQAAAGEETAAEDSVQEVIVYAPTAEQKFLIHGEQNVQTSDVPSAENLWYGKNY